MISLSELGALIGLIILTILVLLIPFILVVIVGIGFANLLGFTGLTWWAFLILFYLVVSGLLAMIGK